MDHRRSLDVAGLFDLSENLGLIESRAPAPAAPKNPGCHPQCLQHVDGFVEHSIACKRALYNHNSRVNNRQARRRRAREGGKK
jgi:hypothetical protein